MGSGSHQVETQGPERPLPGAAEGRAGPKLPPPLPSSHLVPQEEVQGLTDDESGAGPGAVKYQQTQLSAGSLEEK